MGLRFPLETVLRRAQIATFTSPGLRNQGLPVSPTTPKVASPISPEIETIVPTPSSYRGVIGTMWSIVYEEGVSADPDSPEKLLGQASAPASKQQKRRKGQGLKGLYRGWRMGMWGLAGVWSAGFLGAALGNEDDQTLAATARAGMTSGARPAGGSPARGAF